MLEEKIVKSIEENREIAFSLSNYLFENPEVSGQEYGSCKKIREVLEENGIETQPNFLGIETAFFGNVIKKDSDINIAILTEYDALPEVGHACGHCASAAISILSAIALKNNEDLINANIDIIGTPDEEEIGMKIPMSEAGVFDKYDMAIMVHLYNKNIPNWRMLALQGYEVSFKGKAAHTAASPWDGKSALDASMLLIHAMDMKRKSVKPYTVMEYIITDGGAATNIIPENSTVKLSLRAEKIKYLKEELYPWLENAITGVSMISEVQSEIKLYGNSYSDMNYLESGVNILKEIMSDYQMEYETMDTPGASSDMGNVSYRCPAFHPSIQITKENFALHSKEFAEVVGSEQSKTAILNGAKLIDSFIVRLIENPEKLKEIKKEFLNSVTQK